MPSVLVILIVILAAAMTAAIYGTVGVWIAAEVQELRDGGRRLGPAPRESGEVK